jgi:hypothetical protein
MALSAFPISPDLTAVAVAYRNPGYIADIVLPRIQVAKQKFTFLQYPADTFFNIPDTRVGRRSKPGVSNLEGIEITDSCDDFGQDAEIPNEDELNSDQRYNLTALHTGLLQEQIALDREARAAAIVHGTGSYDPSLQVTLSGTGQYSDKINSDPVTNILNYLELPLMRPTDMTMNTEVFTQLRTHPKIVQAIYGTAATAGAVTIEQLKTLFGVQRINVGQARRNLNKRGQPLSLGRLWGKHIGLTYNAPVAAKDIMTFGASFQFGERIAGEWDDKDIGLRGGIRVRTGESMKERSIAPMAGFLISNVIP